MLDLSAKLNIRRMKETDAAALHELLSDEDVMRYIEPVFTMEQTVEFLDKAGLSDSPLIYAVDDENGAFIGYVIYHDYEAGSKEIGWVLKKDAWGKGYASTLTSRLIDMAKAEGKDAIIECSPNQLASRHIAEKFGFAYIGQRDGCDVFEFITRKR